MLTIRKARYEDRGHLVSFFYEMLLEGNGRNAVLPIKATLDNARMFYEIVLREAIESGDPVLVVVDEQDTPCAALFWAIYRGPFEPTQPLAFGHGCWVRPDLRKQGWSRMLRRVGEDILRDKGCLAIDGAVDITNIAGISSVFTQGFEVHAGLYRKVL